MWKKILIISLFIVLIITIPVCIYLWSKNVNSNNQNNQLFNELKFLVSNSIPSTTDSDLIFVDQFEGFETAVITYESKDESIITSSGKVYKKIDEQVVLIHITIDYLGKTETIKKSIKVKPLNESEIKDYLINSINIPETNFTGILLPLTIPELNCEVSYYEYAQRVSGGNRVDEPSIRVVEDSEHAYIEQTNINEVIRCFIVVTFEYIGNVFTHNYPVYTK